MAFLTKAGFIQDGEYSVNNISQAVQDALLCIEMPIFGWMHWYAFPWTDYEDKRLSSRLQLQFAIRDALGIKDIIFDTKVTFRNLFFTSRGHIYLEDDELIPFRDQSVETHYNTQHCPIEFEIDASEEEDYRSSRSLVYGDFRFPVIHDDWRHPPDIQLVLNRNANEFYSAITNSGQNAPPLNWYSDDELVNHQ